MGLILRLIWIGCALSCFISNHYEYRTVGARCDRAWHFYAVSDGLIFIMNNT
ncbi:DUF2754 family protein [Yersinia intermedia]|uniref:DUF2754 family protein n=1 Tax=Yersinia intermedia TaxID=631 RepID=A0ABX6FDP3_YERIN|nr:DUF2754 family protein [Yersinia intermedia]QGR71813.1 DUF2754 family protein [Yersinia intermedia]